MKLRLKQVEKRYGEHRALSGFNLELDEAKCLTFIGPSGGGKSTALRLIAGLEPASSGSIEVNGTIVPEEESLLREYRKGIGVVFQSYNLFPHLDALTNLSLPLEKVHGRSPKAARERAMDLLERFQLKQHANKKPAELSGGQNQRVAIARALAHDPSLILFDEPTSALDPDMSTEVLDVIEELIRDGKDCIVVTHQMGFAKRASDSVAFIVNGQVETLGESEGVFSAPESTKLQRFLDRELRY